MTSTATDTEILEALDFTPSCEHSQHREKHPGDEPAKYIVRGACTACGDAAVYLMCRPGWERVQLNPLIGCGQCGCHAPGMVTVTILDTLQGDT